MKHTKNRNFLYIFQFSQWGDSMNKLYIAGLLSLSFIQLANALDEQGNVRLSRIKSELSRKKSEHARLTREIGAKEEELARAHAEETTREFHAQKTTKE